MLCELARLRHRQNILRNCGRKGIEGEVKIAVARLFYDATISAS